MADLYEYAAKNALRLNPTVAEPEPIQPRTKTPGPLPTSRLRTADAVPPESSVSKFDRSIRAGMERDTAQALLSMPNPEDALARWEAATEYAREYGLDTYETFVNLDAIVDEYFVKRPNHETLAKSIKDSFEAAKLSLELGKTVSKYMGSVTGIPEAIKGALGFPTTEADKAGYKAKADELSKRMGELSLDITPRTWMGEWLKIGASVVPYTADIAVKGAIAVGATAITGGALGIANLGPLKAFVSAGVRFAEAYEITRGLNFIEMTSRGISERDAMVASSIAAAGASAVESVLSIEAGLTSALTGGAAKALSEAVITKLGVSGLLTSGAAKFAGRLVLNTASEMLEEGSQEVITGIATILAQTAQEQGVVFNPIDGKDIVEDTARSIWAAAVTAPFLGLSASAGMAISDHKAALDLAKNARHMGKSEFEALAAKHPALQAIGVSEEERKKLAGKIWETQAEAAVEEAREAAATTRASAKAGVSPDGTGPDLKPGALFIQADASGKRDAEGNRSVTYLVGLSEGATKGDTMAQVETLVSDNTVIITGGVVEGQVIPLTSDMIAGISARNPGKEIKLGTGVGDAALQGGYERFMEQGGPSTSVDISLEDAIEEERLITEIEKTAALGRPKTRVAVELLRALNTAVNGKDAPLYSFTQYLTFKPSASADSQAGRYKVMGSYQTARDPVTGAVDITTSLITLAKGAAEEDTLDTLAHESFHYFRTFLGSMAPDNKGLKAIEAEYGITNGQWDVASEERFVAEARAWMAKRKGASEVELSNEKVGLFERFADFIRALYDAIKTEVPEAVATAMEGWFGDYKGTDPGEIEVSKGMKGALHDDEHLEITRAKSARAAAKRYIAAASKHSGKPESYYDDLVRLLAPRIGVVRNRLSRAGSPGKIRSALIGSGAWVTNPQLVAEIKWLSGMQLDDNERALINFASNGALAVGPLGPGALYSVKSVQDLEGGINGEAFKKWFGDSKVVDSQAKIDAINEVETARKALKFDESRLAELSDSHPLYRIIAASRSRNEAALKEAEARLQQADRVPLLLHHGGSAGIEVFRRTDGGRAIWMSSYPIAETYKRPVNGEVYGLYARIENPLEYDAQGATWQELEYRGERVSTDGLATIAEEEGYDGLIIRNLYDSNTDDGGDVLADHYAVFNPTQIKSVNNRGTWSTSDPSILRSVREAATDKTVFDKVIAYQGETDNIYEAGFVLPDGRMVDLSGRIEDPDYRKDGSRFVTDGADYMAGKRLQAHSEVAWDGSPKGARGYLVRQGAARVDAKFGIIELDRAPTPEQKKKLEALFLGNPVALEAHDRGGREFALNEADPKKAFASLARFFSGEDIESDFNTYLDSSTMLYSVQEFDEERPRPEVKYETEAKGYKSFDSWIASMYADASGLSDRDREWLRMVYDNAHKGNDKRFKRKGDFARFLGTGREFYNFIFNLGRVINGQDRLTDEAEATRARRLERAISQTPELKNLVDTLYETGVGPTPSQMRAAIAEIRRHESLYKYAYAVLQSDQDLAFEAISELDEVPLLARRDLLGTNEMSIAEQAAIIEALKDARIKDEVSSLGEKIKNGTITIDEMREYVKSADEMYEKELAEEKAKGLEAEKQGRAEERAKGREKVKAARASEKAKLNAYKKRQKERAAAKKMLREMERLERFIFTRPSSRVDYNVASLIMAMQEALAAKKPINKETLSMLQSFNAVYDAEWRETIDSFINVLNAMSSENRGALSLEFIKLTASLFDAMLTEGRRSLRDKEIKWGLNVKSIRAEIVAELMAGKYWKPDTFGESKEESKRKKKLDKIAMEFDALRPDAFFRKYLGKRAVALLFDESVRARSAKYRNYDRRTAAVTDYVAKNHLMKKGGLNRELVLNGVYSGGPITITGRELLGIRLLLGTKTDFNEKQREALVYGNFFTSQEKNVDGTIPGAAESANTYMAKQYDKKVKALLEFTKEHLTAEEETLARMMLASTDNERDWHRFASAVIFLTNKEPKKEKFYFPIFRDGDFGIDEDAIVQELKSYGIEPGLDNSMALERADIQPRNHKRVKLDAVSVFYSSISKQEHLTEVGPYAKRLAGVFEHGELAQSARTTIKESLGQKTLDYIDNQVKTIVNPVQYDAKASGGELLRFYRGSQVVANLAFRWTSFAMQMLTSPLPGLMEAPLELVGSATRAWSNPLKFVSGCEELSAILKNRQLDPQHAELLKRNEQGVASAFDKVAILGMSPLSWADRFSVAIVWDAVYRKHLAELERDGNPLGGSKEARAIEYADRFTLKTQPTSDAADRSPMYRDMNTFKALVLQFTQPLNVIYNNIRMDMPQAVREREYAKAIGILTAYTLSGLAIGLIGTLRGRGPDDDDDAEAYVRYWLHASTAQFTDAIPFVGEVITGLTGNIITGDNNAWMRLDRNMPAVDFIARSIEGMAADNVDWLKVAKNATMGLGQMAGAPMKAIDEAIAAGRWLAGEE